MQTLQGKIEDKHTDEVALGKLKTAVDNPQELRALLENARKGFYLGEEYRFVTAMKTRPDSSNREDFACLDKCK